MAPIGKIVQGDLEKVTIDIDDIETQLIGFVIRKYQPITNDSGNAQKAQNSNGNCLSLRSNCLYYVPLMLADLQTVKQQNKSFDHPWGSSVSSVFNMCDGAVTFSYCIVYGRIVDYRIRKNVHSYIIDDGTALAEIVIFRQSEQTELERLSRLQNELEAVFRYRPGKLHESLKRIIHKTKDHLDMSNIPIGTKILVCGVPDFYHGKTYIKAFSLYKDVGIKRDTEIAFKEELIEFYTSMNAMPTD